MMTSTLTADPRRQWRIKNFIAPLVCTALLGFVTSVVSAQDKDGKKVMFSRDSMELENFRADKETALSKSRLRRIKLLTKMIDKNKSATDMPDLLFRLAELEWDEAKYQYFLKRKEFDKLMIAYDEKTVTKRPAKRQAQPITLTAERAADGKRWA